MSVIPEDSMPRIAQPAARAGSAETCPDGAEGTEIAPVESILGAMGVEHILGACLAALATGDDAIRRPFALLRAHGEDGLRELARAERGGSVGSLASPGPARFFPADDPCTKALELRTPAVGPATATLWVESGVERLLALSVRVEEHVVAVIAVEPAPGRASADASAVEDLRRVARLAEMALGRLHQGTELRQWAHQAQLLQEMSQSTLSHMNVAEGLARVTRIVCQALNARGSALWVAGPRGEALRLESTFGPAANRERVARALEAVAHDRLSAPRLQCIESPERDSRLLPEVATSLRAIACVPIVAYDEVRGVLALYDPFPRSAASPPGFSRGDLAFLTLAADQAAVILENARLYERIRRGEKGRGDDRGPVLQLERRAGLGELCARAAQEARHPLNSIGGFARRALKAAADDDPQRDGLEVIAREADRLERLLAEQLQFAV